MNEKDTIKSISAISKHSASDHIVSAIKAILSTVPFGGGLASLMSDYIPSSKHDRIIGFTKQIAADFERLKDKIDEVKLQTDEFAYILEGCYKGVAENYQEIKLNAFRGILINSATGNDPTTDEKEYFLGLVSSLSVLHIRILLFMSKPKKYLEYYNISETLYGGFTDMFLVAMPKINIEVIKAAFGDLYRNGFLNTDKTIFGTMTSGQGLSLLENRVTELGKRFIDFCSIDY